MPDSWETGAKEGHRTKTIQAGNCIVRIHRPILNEQERTERENQVRDALRGLIAKGKLK